MYKLSQVRNKLNCSATTVKRLIAKGDLEFVRVNARTIRVTEAALEAFIADRTGRKESSEGHNR
jgi:excisionase family DNA binding protein